MQSKLLKLIKQSFNFMIIIIMISTLISINNIEQTKKNNITEKTIERPFNKREIKKISAGDSHSLAIDKSGNLWVWGDNSFGQLGKGTKDDISAPLQIKQGTKFVELSYNKA